MILFNILALSLSLISGVQNISVTSPDECTDMHLMPQVLKLNNGEDGVWLPTNQMACVSKRLEQWRLQSSIIDSQNELISAQEREIKTATDTVALVKLLANEERLRGDDFKNLAMKQAQEIENSKAWYHSPFLYVGIGATVTSIVAILLTH